MEYTQTETWSRWWWWWWLLWWSDSWTPDDGKSVGNSIALFKHIACEELRLKVKLQQKKPKTFDILAQNRSYQFFLHNVPAIQIAVKQARCTQNSVFWFHGIFVYLSSNRCAFLYFTICVPAKSTCAYVSFNPSRQQNM